MATSWCIEIETGTSTGQLHPHNGYYAGEFFATVADQASSAAAELIPDWTRGRDGADRPQAA
jgi:hypothetical protein